MTDKYAVLVAYDQRAHCCVQMMRKKCQANSFSEIVGLRVPSWFLVFDGEHFVDQIIYLYAVFL